MHSANTANTETHSDIYAGEHSSLLFPGPYPRTPARAHTLCKYNGLCFLPLLAQLQFDSIGGRRVPQMTIEIELTDESSSKTLAVMAPQLRLTARISP